MKIIICGSMTVSKEMVALEKQLKELGNEVVLPDLTYDYALINTFNETHKESVRYKNEHDAIRKYFEKIKNSDAILVTNIERNGVKGYIGGNTFLEMGFAHILNKPIYLLNEIPRMNYKDEIEAMRPIVINGNIEKIVFNQD